MHLELILRLKEIIELLADFANWAIYHLLPYTWQRMALGPETGSVKLACYIGHQNNIDETIPPLYQEYGLLPRF